MAIGSAGSSVLAVKVLNVKLPAVYWFVLPLCVWIIYTADHLLDAIKIKNRPGTGRHYFHFLNQKVLFFLLCILGILSFILIPGNFNRNIIIYGCCLFSVILIYLLSNYFIQNIFRFFPRELFIALGYIAGTWGIPLITGYPEIRFIDFLVLFNHFLIIFSIPVLYSIYEYKSDMANNFISFTTSYGFKIAKFIEFIIIIFAVVISIISILFIHRNYYLIMLFMGMILFFILISGEKFSRNEYYRTIADSLNYLPFLLLIHSSNIN